MKVLILAEHNNEKLSASTLPVVTAAKRLGGELDILVAGSECQSVVDECARIEGVRSVLYANGPQYRHALAEEVAPLICAQAEAYQAVLASSTTYGKNILPRAAALLDVQAISDVIAIDSDSQFKRPVYAGNVIATVTSSDPIKILTVRTTAFEPAEFGSDSAPNKTVPVTDPVGISEFVGEELAQSERPELAAAKVVISGGRGLQSGENFEMLYELADKLGAAVGASRAAVDAGYVPNDLQVGQTGKIVAPNLYIAVGISGAIQHLAGMKDSKVIVAINKDADAPIFQSADYGLVGDLFEIIPELTEKL